MPKSCKFSNQCTFRVGLGTPTTKLQTVLVEVHQCTTAAISTTLTSPSFTLPTISLPGGPQQWANLITGSNPTLIISIALMSFRPVIMGLSLSSCSWYWIKLKMDIWVVVLLWGLWSVAVIRGVFIWSICSWILSHSEFFALISKQIKETFYAVLKRSAHLQLSFSNFSLISIHFG